MPIFMPNELNKIEAIVTFIIPILVNFITMKYQGMLDSPFDTHPVTVFLTIFTLLLYCFLSLPLVAHLPVFHTARGVRIFLFLRVFSFLSVAFLTSLLFRGLSFFLLYLPLLMMLFLAHSWDLVQNLMQKMLLSTFDRMFGRGGGALLPRTIADAR
ncbi:hypothetical protein BT93_B1219 [Corymbia citriodora subsp. variegata]|nr:hypothetical protein BT93_B1219 [Corymbia citriodora subsp. variegata]